MLLQGQNTGYDAFQGQVLRQVEQVGKSRKLPTIPEGNLPFLSPTCPTLSRNPFSQPIQRTVG